MIDKLLKSRLIILYLLPFILGCLTLFSFQPFNFSVINFFVLPVLFYLIVNINKRSKNIYRKKPYKKNFFIFGTSFGFGFYLGGIHWIVNSLTFDETFKFLIPFALILIPLFLSLFFSILIVIVGPFLNFNIGSVFLLSGGLAFSDFLRAKVLTGFPWNLWAYSFSWATEFIQLLSKTGLFTFNLIVITFFMLPTFILLKMKLTKKIVLLFFIPLIYLVLYLYGDFSINQNKEFLQSYKIKYKIKIISPNFKLEYGLSEKEINERMDRLIKYSEPNIGKTKTLFIWPEGVFSGYNFNEILSLKNKFEENFKDNHQILFGVNRLDKEKNRVKNSMVIVNKNLEIISEYHKQKLVPFGEFLPFEKILKKIGLKKITEGHGSFLKGNKQENLIINELNILPLICYEIIFTKFTQLSSPETNLIINISEDGWFGNSIGPHQHFAKAIFRAIEQNSFLVRSANKGASAIISNKGEIIKKLDKNEAGNIELEVPLIKSEKKNKNDLIFFILLITYIFIFKLLIKKNVK